MGSRIAERIGEGWEGSIVDLVVAVCEWTEDENEIFDEIDALLASGRVRLLPVL